MKKFLSSPFLIYPLIIAGIIADFKYNVAWAGNLSLFSLWVLTISGFAALFIDSKELFKVDSYRVSKIAMSFVCVMVQVAAGWIVIAVLFLVVSCLLIGKRQSYEAGNVNT